MKTEWECKILKLIRKIISKKWKQKKLNKNCILSMEFIEKRQITCMIIMIALH